MCLRSWILIPVVVVAIDCKCWHHLISIRCAGVTQTGATLTRCSPSMGRTTLTAPWTGDNLQELCQGMGSTTTTLIGGGHMYHQRDSWTIVHEFSVTFSPKVFITDCSKWAFWSWLEKRGVSKFQHNWGCQPNLKTLRKFKQQTAMITFFICCANEQSK